MIARVFPRRTKASPVDDLAFFGPPPFKQLLPEIHEVHVSIAFTWDIAKAEKLARQWESVAPVKIGGPATGMQGEEFVSGRYLKPGYTITSRGCPNHCWFCEVPKREGNIRELPIVDGWNILDDNLLACSDLHIGKVFKMLQEHRGKVQFTGGLEAAKLKEWHIGWFLLLKVKQMFFAYDTPADWDPLVSAVDKLKEAGFNRQSIRAYVLIGFGGDTFDAAEKRLRSVVKLGAFPMAMLLRDKSGRRDSSWLGFQKQWARPAFIARAMAN